MALLDHQKLYSDLVEYKAMRGYGNIFISKSELTSILQGCTLYVSAEDSTDLDFLQSGAQALLRSYLDRLISRKEREAESKNLEPGVLLARERIAPYYTVRLTDELLKEVEKLLKRKKELYHSGGKPLPRLYIDRHLYNPILLDPTEHGMKDLAVSPPGLKKNEKRFVEDVVNFWGSHRDEPEFKDSEVTLLRNLPRVGVGFFKKSGFYPDFILWVKNRKTKETVVRFIEPHGMHHGGISGNQDKIDSLKNLEMLSREERFRKKNVQLDGFILTETELAKIPGAEKLTWNQLRDKHKIFRQEGDYCREVLRIG
jgi:hypothetical protein